MITAAQLTPFRTTSDDYNNTQRLKAKAAQLLRERHPLYLTDIEFEEILAWKLGQQMGRQRQRRTSNTNDIIRIVTGRLSQLPTPTKNMKWNCE